MVAISTLWHCRNPETPGSLTFREGSSAAGADVTPPVVGTQVAFSNVSDTTLTVSWGSATDIVTPTVDLQYKLVKAATAAEIDTIAEVDAIPAGADLLQNYTNNDTTQDVTALTAGATYFFAVVVKDIAGNKSLYAPMSQTMAAPDTTPPVVGAAISFTSVSDTSMTVNWGAATDAVTVQTGLQYRLVKATAIAAIDTIAEVDAIAGGDLLQDYNANDVTQSVAGLAASTTYFFAVVVRDVAGNKAIYAPVSQTTNAAADVTPPNIGTAISFASITATTLTVNWGHAADAITAQAALEYRLVRATTSAAIDTIAEVDAISGGDLLQNYTANDITQNVSGLVEGSTWFYAVVVRDVAGNKALYAPASQATTSAPPTVGTAISFASVTETSFTVNWGAATDAGTAQANLEYRLVTAATSAAIDTVAEVDAISGGALLQDYTANDITQNVTGLTAGTTYFFAVVVRDAVGNKTLYTPASQTTADTTAPTVGTAISFSSVAGTTMTVNWGAATDAVTPQANLQYRLVKATTAAAIDTIAEVDAISGGDLLQNYTANDITQNVTGLSGSTTYYFAVVVRDTTGNKTIYTPASQMTLDINAPTVGTAISFTSVVETSLTVNWGAATDTVTPQANLEYRLVKATTSTAIDTIGEVEAITGGDLLQDYTANDIAQNVTGLSAGTIYFFAAVVRDAAGNKALYTPASQATPDLTPPTIGTAISFSSITGTSMAVNWGAATDAVTSQASLQYRLVKSTTSAAIDTITEVDAISGADLLQNYTANDVTQNVTGLTGSTTYYFAVVVRDAAGNKSLYAVASQETGETVPPAIGAAISLSNMTDTTLTVTWGAATDAVTPQVNLEYRLVQATSSTAIDTIAEVDAISGGNLLQDYTANDLTQSVTGLAAGSTYFFAVVVRDQANNKAIYTPRMRYSWTNQTLPSSSQWRSVTFGNGVFVAVASGPSTTAATSPDGKTWTARTLPSSQNWNSVTFANGIFIALAGGTNAATSPDGITWTMRTMSSFGSWQSVAFGNGVYSAIDYGSTAASTSPDGITWTQQTVPTSANWQSVAFGNGAFTAIAYGSNIAATSPDGITWTMRTLPSSVNWKEVTFANGIFVAVASNTSTAATSPDGINWTARTMSNFYTNSVTYGNGVFVSVSASAQGGSTSPDGVTWTDTVGAFSGTSVAFGNGVFVSVEINSTNAATLP